MFKCRRPGCDRFPSEGFTCDAHKKWTPKRFQPLKPKDAGRPRIQVAVLRSVVERIDALVDVWTIPGGPSLTRARLIEVLVRLAPGKIQSEELIDLELETPKRGRPKKPKLAQNPWHG